MGVFLVSARLVATSLSAVRVELVLETAATPAFTEPERAFLEAASTVGPFLPELTPCEVASTVEFETELALRRAAATSGACVGGAVPGTEEVVPA